MVAKGVGFLRLRRSTTTNCGIMFDCNDECISSDPNLDIEAAVQKMEDELWCCTNKETLILERNQENVSGTNERNVCSPEEMETDDTYNCNRLRIGDYQTQSENILRQSSDASGRVTCASPLKSKIQQQQQQQQRTVASVSPSTLLYATQPRYVEPAVVSDPSISIPDMLVSNIQPFVTAGSSAMSADFPGIFGGGGSTGAAVINNSGVATASPFAMPPHQHGTNNSFDAQNQDSPNSNANINSTICGTGVHTATLSSVTSTEHHPPRHHNASAARYTTEWHANSMAQPRELQQQQQQPYGLCYTVESNDVNHLATGHVISTSMSPHTIVAMHGSAAAMNYCNVSHATDFDDVYTNALTAFSFSDGANARGSSQRDDTSLSAFATNTGSFIKSGATSSVLCRSSSGSRDSLDSLSTGEGSIHDEHYSTAHHTHLALKSDHGNNSILLQGDIKREPDDDYPIESNGSHLSSLPASDNDLFCSVPGRLSLLSSNTKYKVTVGEIRRRINAPECLNASLLGGVLRRAKSKDGGRKLREKLRRMGLSLPAGRRKAANVTLMTSLVEGESEQLAAHFDYLCEAEFPSGQLADQIAESRETKDRAELQNRKNAVIAAKHLTKELQDILVRDPYPNFCSEATTDLSQSTLNGLNRFGLLTHGFGCPAIHASLNAFQSYLSELLTIYERDLLKHGSGVMHVINKGGRPKS